MGSVSFGYVDVYDELFTRELANSWKLRLAKSYESVFTALKAKRDASCPIRFTLCESLLDDVSDDAIIGMRKITRSNFNTVEAPNAFKVTAYLTYWWLRHKPAAVHCQLGFKFEDAKVIRRDGIADEQYEEECQRFAWQLKHINELVAVNFALTSMFDFESEVCAQRAHARVKRVNGDNFVFDNFDDQRLEVVDKLTYYFAYRPLTPKVIEHLLEAYTFHPAWKLTGPHWKTEGHGA